MLNCKFVNIKSPFLEFKIWKTKGATNRDFIGFCHKLSDKISKCQKIINTQKLKY